MATKVSLFGDPSEVTHTEAVVHGDEAGHPPNWREAEVIHELMTVMNENSNKRDINNSDTPLLTLTNISQN